MIRASLAVMLVALLSAGCQGNAGRRDAGNGKDAGLVGDGGGTDAGVNDAGPGDAGTIDAGGGDAGTTDAGTTDAGTTDAGRPDAGTTDAGATDAGVTDAGPTDAGVTDAGLPDAGAPTASVTQHHNDAARTGVYVVAGLTHAVAAGMHRDASFSATISGPTYAQPLYLASTGGGPDLVIVATEQDIVYALSAANGQVVWQKTLGTPVPLNKLPCGNVDPLGITGTPIIDLATRTLYVDAMTTPDGGTTKKHLVFALDVDTGNVRAGWPVDVNAAVSGFDSSHQNERGALALMGGRLYVPYGGHYGDCGNYHGWVVGISTTDPTQVGAWSTPAVGGGIWAPGGIASDGQSVFAATGNTSYPQTWQGGEAVIRFGPGPTFSNQTQDYWAPTNWQYLDQHDIDIGGSGPVLFDVPGASPSHLAVALGKNGDAYLLDRTNLGGVSNAVAQMHVASSTIIGAAIAYQTAQGTYVAFRGTGTGCPNGQYGSLVALKIAADTPPGLSIAWCANSHGIGAPIFTTTGGGADPMVWIVGNEGDNRLHGYDADTGTELFTGGGANDQMGSTSRYEAPIVGRGRIFFAGNNAVYAFTR